MVLSFIESYNKENYDLDIFFYQENVSTFDIYRLTDKNGVPHYIHTTSKSVKQYKSVAMIQGSINKCDTDHLSRYIIIIFFKDGTCCVTPYFDISYVSESPRVFNMFYQGFYTNPLELIKNEIN